MKRTLITTLLAVAGAAIAPLMAAGQVNPDSKASTQQAAAYKWEAYAGFAYTSLVQVNQSRYGLIGGKATLTRDWGKYFGLMGTADYYKPPISSRTPKNPGDPSVYSFAVGPEFHTNIYEKWGGLVYAELGGEHTGGESMTPTISLAGGFGGGLTYNLTNRWAIRATGDRLAGSFSLSDNTGQLGYSTHRTWNARATFGVVYRF